MEHPTNAMEHREKSISMLVKFEPRNHFEKNTTKSKTRRGYGRKNNKNIKNANKVCEFSILGTNANGLLGKQESLKNNINHFKPSIVTIQESKLKRIGSIKLHGYQIFEKHRDMGQGGGLFTAVDENMAPVLISNGKEEAAEILTVQIKVGTYNIRVVNAYGPQEDDNIENIYNFWQEIENEVIAAKENDCLILVQMDANAKIGREKHPMDPNEESKNGKIMTEMVERQQLTIGNTVDKCRGAITRERVVLGNTEKAILDYILICERMKAFLDEIMIDEDRLHVLTKYSSKKRKTVLSDHNIMFAKFKLKYSCLPPSNRKEVFNLKDLECQKKFLEETSNNLKLSTCFTDTRSFIHNSKIFFKHLKGSIFKSFKRIRITVGNKTKQGENILQEMLKNKKELKIVALNAKSDHIKTKAEEKIAEIDDALREKYAAKWAEIIKNESKHIKTLEGKFSQIGFWKLKKKLCPQVMDPPMAKINEDGILVTAPNLLRDLYLRTYKHRLRQRQMKIEYYDMFFLKTELWNSRMIELTNAKSEPWSMKKLIKVLKSLKNNKTMDPNGMINEIFKPEIAGKDLILGLLDLFNNIKENLLVPDFMNMQNITSIYKSKGSRMDMNNERGIFILTILKKVLDKLIYFDNFDDIDNHMSDSNIGARRGKNIKNHLFMIYGIINSVIRGNEDCIDIQIYDIEKAFDGLWLEDCMNDVYDSISEKNKNDKLALLYMSNQKNQVAVNTSVGLTERITIPNLVQQGGTWGPGLCSNSIDMLGRKSENQRLHNYLYKKKAKVLIFAMCDDLNGVSRCGIESVALNTYINTHIELKKLRFHVPDKKGKSKCNKIHIGRNQNSCSVLKVHGTEMKSVDFDTYLGDIISKDGKNTRNVQNRIAKGVGKITQIRNILTAINLGEYYMETAILLRESIFLNGILTNAEVWYSLTKEEIKKFEDLDRMLLRKLLNVPYSTPSEAFYLELGIIPIGVIIKARRINYLHYILTRKENEMLYTFFKTQWHNETPGDWTQQIKLDLEDLGIPCNFEYIKSKSINSFKKLVKTKAKQYALNLLIDKQKKHSKMKNLSYTELAMQEYFKIEGISTKQAQNVFKWRVRMAPLGENFRGNEKLKMCPLCLSHPDNQTMIFKCESLKNRMKMECEFEDLYSNNITLKTAITITKIEELRENIMKENKNTRNIVMLPGGPSAQCFTVYSVSAAKTASLS